MVGLCFRIETDLSKKEKEVLEKENRELKRNLKTESKERDILEKEAFDLERKVKQYERKITQLEQDILQESKERVLFVDMYSS